jgi:hypothetical protein
MKCSEANCLFVLNDARQELPRDEISTMVLP